MKKKIMFSKADMAVIKSFQGAHASFVFCSGFDSQFIVGLEAEGKELYLSFHGCTFISGRPHWKLGEVQVSIQEQGVKVIDESSGFVIQADSCVLLTPDQFRRKIGFKSAS